MLVLQTVKYYFLATRNLSASSSAAAAAAAPAACFMIRLHVGQHYGDPYQGCEVNPPNLRRR